MEFRFRLHLFTGRRPHLITTSGTVPVLTKPGNYGTCGQIGGELNTTPRYGPSLPAGPKALVHLRVGARCGGNIPKASVGIRTRDLPTCIPKR